MIGAFLPPLQPPRAQAVLPQTITIYQHDSGTFDVHVGEAATGELTFDEMLSEVARLGLRHLPRYLRHVEAIVAYMERRAALYEAKEHARRDRGKCDGNHGGPKCADPECWQQ